MTRPRRAAPGRLDLGHLLQVEGLEQFGIRLAASRVASNKALVGGVPVEDDAAERVEKGDVAARPQRYVYVGSLGGVRAPRIDDDHCGRGVEPPVRLDTPPG